MRDDDDDDDDEDEDLEDEEEEVQVEEEDVFVRAKKAVPKPKAAKTANPAEPDSDEEEEDEEEEEYEAELDEPRPWSDLDDVITGRSAGNKQKAVQRPGVAVGQRVKWLSGRAVSAPDGLKKASAGDGLGTLSSLKNVHGIVRAVPQRAKVLVQWFTTDMDLVLHETVPACIYSLFADEYSLDVERYFSPITP